MTELTPTVGLAEAPVSGNGVFGNYGHSITGCDLEGESLTFEIVTTLPVLAPVSRHGLPTSCGRFDGNGMDVPSSGDVCYQNEVEVRMTVYREPHSSFLPARHSASQATKYEVLRCVYI